MKTNTVSNLAGTKQIDIGTVAPTQVLQDYIDANGSVTWDGATYVDPDAIGANPTAKIYPDGSIVGSTDNGNYTKWANGNLEVRRIAPSTLIELPIAFVGLKHYSFSYIVDSASNTYSTQVISETVNTVTIKNYFNNTTQISETGVTTKMIVLGRWK